MISKLYTYIQIFKRITVVKIDKVQHKYVNVTIYDKYFWRVYLKSSKMKNKFR